LNAGALPTGITKWLNYLTLNLNGIMDLDTSIKKIKQTYYITFSKDVEVNLRYVGTSAGVSEPWLVVIDSYTTKGESSEAAVKKMLVLLKKELEAKIKMAQSQVQSFQTTLNQLTLD
jgi:hypothetical protein